MDLKIASWNLKAGLSRNPQHILRQIAKIDSDIIVLPEAFDNERPPQPEVLGNCGYKYVYEAIYIDKGVKFGKYHRPLTFVALSKIRLRLEVVFLGDFRNCLLLTVADEKSALKGIKIFAVHLDDRCEARRVEMARQVIAHNADIVLGDFNAMRISTLRAAILRSGPVRFMVNLIPMPHFRSLAERLIAMAASQATQLFYDAGYIEANAKGKPSMLLSSHISPRPAIVELDHIIYKESSGLQIVAEPLSLTGSDHLPIAGLAKINR